MPSETKEKTYTVIDNSRLHPNSKPITYYIDENDCHICNSHARTRDGYPRITIKGIKKLLSRYMWELRNNDIPPGMCAMHSCDNPNCINLEHISLGTHRENMQDMARKNRDGAYYGFENSNVALTESDVIGIKKALMSTPHLRQIDIAKKYNVKRSTISEIQRGVRWSEIQVEGFVPIVKRKTPVKLTEEQILDIFQNNELSGKELSQIYGIAKSTVHLIKSGKTFQDVRVSKEGVLL